MSIQASVPLNTARTLLNDDAAAIFTDPVLIPKLQQAHKELQIKLRQRACPVMKNYYTETVAATTLVFATPPNDLIAPIRLWEKAVSDPVTAWAFMTEADPLPDVTQAATMIWWRWFEEAVGFVGSSAQRMVRMLYWRELTVPAANTDLIGVLDGELYLAPRTAALAALSVGEPGTASKFPSLTALADQSIETVILSNRGRAPQIAGAAIRP